MHARRLAGRAVHTNIGDPVEPLPPLLIEIRIIQEGAAIDELATYVASGCRRTSASATDSASPVRPRANKQNARYSSICRETSAEVGLMRPSVASASSYAADA